MGKRALSVYPYGKIDYASLTLLEGILAQDYKKMSKKRFIAYYTSKRKVNNLLNEWLMPKKLCTGFIYAYLEYRFGIEFEPYNFKNYVLQEDYFMKYDDIMRLYIVADRDAIPCFKKHGFLYKEVE